MKQLRFLALGTNWTLINWLSDKAQLFLLACNRKTIATLQNLKRGLFVTTVFTGCGSLSVVNRQQQITNGSATRIHKDVAAA